MIMRITTKKFVPNNCSDSEMHKKRAMFSWRAFFVSKNGRDCQVRKAASEKMRHESSAATGKYNSMSHAAAHYS